MTPPLFNVEALAELVLRVVREELDRRDRERGTATDGYLSTADAAELAGVAVGTIRRWIHEGKLRPYHAGRKLRVSRAELDQLMRHSAKPRGLSPEAMADDDFPVER